jgi:hypothetical protein
MTIDWGDPITGETASPAAPAETTNHSSCGTPMRAARPEDMTPKGRTPEPISDEYAWGYCPRCKVLVAIADMIDPDVYRGC